MQTEIIKAVKILKDGGIILYPTDTIWGLGCDATNLIKHRKYIKLKKEKNQKALITLVSDINMLYQYTNHIPKFNITDQPTTVIYPNVKGLSKNLLPKDRSAIFVFH